MHATDSDVAAAVATTEGRSAVRLACPCCRRQGTAALGINLCATCGEWFVVDGDGARCIPTPRVVEDAPEVA